MTPEEKARKDIDKLLEASGWAVQDLSGLDLSRAYGVAAREFPLKSGEADYVLFAGRKAVGVVEAKPQGTTLSGVAEQTEKYVAAFPKDLPSVNEPLPFAYESTGIETFFRDLRDPDTRSRRVFSFHKPETLLSWAEQETTLRQRLRNTATLETDGLRFCQIEAINNLERSFTATRPRALIQMASGAGKTYTAVSFIYRLIKHSKAHRVLFLVDRGNLGKKTLAEFQQYVTPDDGRKFTELYNVQHMTTNKIDPVSNVCITTIQRLYSMLKGEEEFDAALEEESSYEKPLEDRLKEVPYNPTIPIETFDFIVTDECHRSIYNLWRQALEYFDAFIIGLTATPSKQTLGFFDQNLVMEYGHERAVADGVNVDYDVYRIATKITGEGSKIDKGFYIDTRDKLTRARRWEQLDQDLEYAPVQLDRSVVAPDQIRTVIKTYKEALFTEIFPGRTEVPKTLVFAKDDSHAEDIVHIIREEFGKGNEFCKKITYRTMEDTDRLIASFRNSYHPRIAVTVDMISTGTDIKPLECLIFMRDVRSLTYFEQMKGRGTRTISSTDIEMVTPGTKCKDHFVIVDAVGVCENDKTESRPLEKKRGVSFEKLLFAIAAGKRDKDSLSSLASRLARLNREINPKDRKEIEDAALGKKLPELISTLLESIDPDKKIEMAKEIYKTEAPTEEQIIKAGEKLAQDACKPFDSPNLRNTLVVIQKRNQQIIDTVSKDEVIYSGFDPKAKDKAKSVVDTFKKFIADNKDELTAYQLIYSKPYSQREGTYEEIKRIADTIQKPPYHLTPEKIWQAYRELEKSKVRGTPQKVLTNIISLLRFETGSTDVLEPFTEIVNKRFQEWLKQQEKAGNTFTPEQMEWLILIKDHIATSLSIGNEDFEYAPFYEKGGQIKVVHLFGGKLNKILTELNEVLTA